MQLPANLKNRRKCGDTGGRKHGGELCNGPAMRNGRCRMHGGNCLDGFFSPLLKHGMYAKSAWARLTGMNRVGFAIGGPIESEADIERGMLAVGWKPPKGYVMVADRPPECDRIINEREALRAKARALNDISLARRRKQSIRKNGSGRPRKVRASSSAKIY